MKWLLTHLLTGFLCCTAFLACAQSVTKTLVKSFKAYPAQTLTVYSSEGAMEWSAWSDPYMRVQVQIELENGSEGLLRSLISAGRYQLELQESEGGIFLQMPKLSRKVMVGDQELQEKISFRITVPSDMEVQQRLPDGSLVSSL